MVRGATRVWMAFDDRIGRLPTDVRSSNRAPAAPAPAGRPLDARTILSLQTSAGNAATTAMVVASRPAVSIQRMETQDCPGQQESDVQAAHATATAMLATAEQASHLASDPKVQALAWKHFNIALPPATDDAKRLWFGGVRTALTTMKEGCGDASYECEPNQSWKDGGCLDRNIAISLFNIHLCPNWRALSPDDRAFVLIHEWGHKFARGVNRIFETYCSDPDFYRLPAKERVTLPDAYAGYVFELATGKAPTTMC
jgi:hypothetical protein